MTGITAAVPYAFSALAQLVWRLRTATPRPALRPGRVAAVVGARALGRLHLLLAQRRRTTGTSSGVRS